MSSEGITATKVFQLILVLISMILGITAVVVSYFGLPPPYDAEPLLGFGLFLLALAGLIGALKKKT